MVEKTNLTSKLAVSLFIMILAAAALPAGTIYVDDDGPADFNTIQAAIDDANESDTVFVAPGTYIESVTMKDGVNLQGAGAEDTTIEGRGSYFVVFGANNWTFA